ncbi:MAG: hypothetical protein WBD20_09785 [Pirellulaceae bacterium]
MNAHAFLTTRFDYWSQFGSRQSLIGLTLAVALAMAGCRSPVQREVYSAKLSSEVRVLEDQLYDADYQNRVLRDELKRVKAECEPERGAPTRRLRSESTPHRESYGPVISSPPMMGTIDSSDPMALTDQPPVGFGEGYSSESYPSDTIVGDSHIIDSDPSPRTVPYIQSTPRVDETTGSNVESVSPPPAERENSFSELPAPKIDSVDDGVLPPPSVPEPPGSETFDVPPIEAGRLRPPPLPGSSDDVPDGQIPLPSGLNKLNYSSPVLPDPIIPDHIQLHPTLSSAHQFDQDDAADGLWVVVNVVGPDGQILNLNDFDVDASMTIVALDPTLDSSVAKIGRWDFSAEEVKSFVRSIPVDGFHVPIKWQDNEPTGEEVIVHVRLQAEGEEMRCQGKLQLKTDVAMAKWLPRGGPLNR